MSRRRTSLRTTARALMGAAGRRAPLVIATSTALAVLLLAAADAAARPGGGSSYSGGSSSSSGSSSGRSSSSSSGSSGSSSSGDGDLVALLVWLCIEHPAIGVPVLLVVGFYIVKGRTARTQQDWTTTAPASAPPSAPARGHERRDDDFAELAAVDPDFSRVVFEDFLYGLYAEVHRTRGLPGAPLDRLSAYLSPDAAEELRKLPQGDVNGIIVGALHVHDVNVDASGATIDVVFEANYTEAGRGYYTEEHWTLGRGPGARSRTPDRVRLLGCPGCGAPQEALFAGECRHCRRVVNDGSFDWVVRAIDVVSREPRAPVLTANVEEKGTDLPTVTAPDVATRLAALRAKDPAFDVAAFQARVGLVFQQFQTSWSARDLAGMRPFMSDPLFSTQAYWVAAYTAQRLRNVTERARITNMAVVKVASDPYFDAVTVRLWATGLDYTVADDGHLVSGSRTKERAYSEYWTLIRGTNRRGAARTDLACANCGAPLAVNMVGHCTYCKVKVTTGDFDWVLSRIEQDESYGA